MTNFLFSFLTLVFLWAAAAQPKLTLWFLVLDCSSAEATGDACSRTGRTGPSVIWWKSPVGDASAKAG